jgi:putative membrane protein
MPEISQPITTPHPNDPNSPNDSLVLDTATRLAIERTRVAYERTIMASIRTSTSLITFGFSAYKFFQLDPLDGRTGNAPPRSSILGPKEFGLTMIALGLLSLFLAWFEYNRDVRTLRNEYRLLPRSYIGLVAAIVAVLGTGLLAIVFFNF